MNAYSYFKKFEKEHKTYDIIHWGIEGRRECELIAILYRDNRNNLRINMYDSQVRLASDRILDSNSIEKANESLKQIMNQWHEFVAR